MAIAGVFLVFSYLVIPSVGAMLISDKLSTRLTLGWIGGSIISFIGVKLSWDTGLPTSPLVVVLFALALIATGIYRYLKISPRKSIALRNMAGSLIVVAIFIGGLFFFRKAEEDPLQHTIHMLSSKLGTDRQTAIANLELYGEKKDLWLPILIERLHDEDAQVRKLAVDLITKLREKSAVPEIVKLLHDPSDEVRRSAIEAIRTLGDGQASLVLVETAKVEEDVEMRIQLLETALELGNSEAIPQLIGIISDGGVFADDAFDHLRQHIRFEFKLTEPQRVQIWWNENHARLHWDASAKVFEVQR